MAREPAELEIIETQISPSTLTTGDNAEIVVTVKDNNTDSTTDWNAGWVEVTSPELPDPIIGKCIIFGPGATLDIDDSSIDTNNYDGEFPITEPVMDINVRVGGFEEGNECAFRNFGSAHFVTDSTSFTIETEGESVDPPSAVVESVSSNATSFEPGERIRINATVTNNGGEGTVGLQFGAGTSDDPFGHSTVGEENYMNAGERQTYSAEIEVPPAGGEWDTIGARITKGGSGSQTAPITIELTDEQIKEVVRTEIVGVSGSEQHARVEWQIVNDSPYGVEVDIAVPLAEFRKTYTIDSLGSDGGAVEMDFNNQAQIQQEICVNTEEIRVLR